MKLRILSLLLSLILFSCKEKDDVKQNTITNEPPITALPTRELQKLGDTTDLFLEFSLMRDSLFIESKYFGQFSYYRIYQDSLFATLKSLKKPHKDSLQEYPDLEIILRADSVTPMSELNKLISLISEAGYHDCRFAFSTEEKKSSFFSPFDTNTTPLPRYHFRDSNATIHYKDKYAILYGVYKEKEKPYPFSILSIPQTIPYSNFYRALSHAYWGDSANSASPYIVSIDTTCALLKVPPHDATHTFQISCNGEIFQTDIILIDSPYKILLPIIPESWFEKRPGGTPASGGPLMNRHRISKPCHPKYRNITQMAQESIKPQLRNVLKEYQKEHPETKRARVAFKWGVNAKGEVTYCRAHQYTLKDKILERKLISVIRNWDFSNADVPDEFTEVTFPFTIL